MCQRPAFLAPQKKVSASVRLFTRHDTAAAQPAAAASDPVPGAPRAAQCCVLGCDAPAQDRIAHQLTIAHRQPDASDPAAPASLPLALAVPLCEAHTVAFRAAFPSDAPLDAFPAGAVARLLLAVGEALRDETPTALERRSEERRVGKECGSWR